MEVAQRMIGADTVRCIMLAGSEGIARGMEVTATSGGIRVPVGECTLGRMFNALGEPIDGEGALPDGVERWPASTGSRPRSRTRRPTSKSSKRASRSSICSSRMPKGGKIGLFGGAGVGKTVLIQELDPQRRHRARRLFGLYRRRRAQPRGQRPVVRDARKRRVPKRPRSCSAR